MARSPASLRSRPLRAAAVGLAASCIAAALLVTGALDGPERASWDWRVRLLAERSRATEDVVLILVDQESLRAMSDVNAIDWPWPRSLYGYMLAFLQEAGAHTVTFDIILEDGGRFGVGDDRELLAAAERHARTIYGVELLRGADTGGAAQRWPDHIGRPALSVAATSPDVETGPRFTGGSFPHSDVIPENATVAFVNQENDADGVFRRYRLIAYHGEQPVPSLSLAPLVAAADEVLDVRFERGRLVIDGRIVPVDRDGKVLLRYTTPGDRNGPDGSQPLHNWFPAFDIVISGFNLVTGSDPTVDPSAFSGRHVMVGLSASGLLDLRPTPLDPRAPGVSVHATMLDNLLAGAYMRDLPPAASLVLLLLLAMGVAFAATYAVKSWVELAVIAGAVAVSLLAGLGGYQLGFWVPMVALIVAGIAAGAGANVANYATEGAQKRFIREAFSRYLSHAVIAELEADPRKLRLEGIRRELTMLFSDIRGFTTLSEGLEPEQLSGFLNHYLTECVEIIQASGGTIDKFEGDAIIAFWNAPLEVADHPEHAVRAALACQRRLAELRPLYGAPIGTVDAESGAPGVGHEIHTRMGIHTAEVSVGNFGSRTRFDYTALGDGMNLASRLEGANKTFGTSVLISGSTAGRLPPSIAVRELGRISVVGREEPVTVYEPMVEETAQRRAAELADYGRALQLFYDGRIEEARQGFAGVATTDAAAASMAAICDRILAGGRATEASWAGVVTLTDK